jgi:hypothetical protein
MAKSRAKIQKSGSELLEKLQDDATYKEFLNIAKGNMTFFKLWEISNIVYIFHPLKYLNK